MTDMKIRHTTRKCVNAHDRCYGGDGGPCDYCEIVGDTMTDTNNGWWPNKPGEPLNPEKDGAHRLRHQISGLESDALWSCGGTWLDLNGNFSIPDAAAFYDYLGPCLTPNQATELQARVTKLEEMLDSAARVLHKAGEQFTIYANAHSAKGTVDGNAKAETNRKWAERCYNAHDAILFGQNSTFVVLALARNFGKSSGNVRNMLSAQSREIDRLRAELKESVAERDALKKQLTDIALNIPTERYMKPSDGGNVSIAEQVARMCQDVHDLESEKVALEYGLNHGASIVEEKK